MKRSVSIIRINPERRTIAKIAMKSAKSHLTGTREAKRIIRADVIGMRQILDMGAAALMVAGRMDVTESMAGWRFPGSEETAGISFLFGRGVGGGVVDCPVDIDWVTKRIIWMQCEYDPGEQA